MKLNILPGVQAVKFRFNFQQPLPTNPAYVRNTTSIYVDSLALYKVLSATVDANKEFTHTCNSQRGVS